MDLYKEENRMEKYKKMYAILCGAISDALDVLPYLPEDVQARFLLEKALQEAEELYISEESEEQTS